MPQAVCDARTVVARCAEAGGRVGSMSAVPSPDAGAMHRALSTAMREGRLA